MISPSDKDILKEAKRGKDNHTKTTNKNKVNSLQGHFTQLFLCEVEGVIVGCDAVLPLVRAGWQVGAQDAVVQHIDEGYHGMPPLVVEPHLAKEEDKDKLPNRTLATRQQKTDLG